MKIIDLSQKFENGMPQFPNTELIHIEQISQVKEDGFRVTNINSTVHNGTHCDAPAHCINGGKTIEEFPLDTFIGDAIILDADIEKSREISIDILKDVEIKPGDIVLIRTGHSKYWGEEKYIDESPYITEELGVALSKLDIKAVGIDCLSLDPVDDLTTPIHNILMEKNIILIENLNNLDAIQDSRIFFSAAPLLVDKSDGSLIRAYAIIFEKLN